MKLMPVAVLSLILGVAAVALAAVVLTGCSSASTAASHPAAAPSSAAPSSAAPSPSPSPVSTARLTRSQARRAYAAIVDPSNLARDAVNRDFTDRVPFAQFRRDQKAYLASVRTMAAKLSAVRWPARVAPYVRAMVATDLQASIRCAQAELRARSYSGFDAAFYGPACAEVQNSTNQNASQIRSLLHLPPPEG
jgi:hypothetical protein